MLTSPTFNVCMVSTDQNFRYFFPSKSCRSRILWTFKEAGHTVRKTVILGARLVAQYAGQQSGHSFNYRQGRDFTSTKHKIANTEFIRDQLGTNPFVDAFISPAN